VNWSAPFEEIEEGTRFTTRGRTITESDVVGFAALTGDWHPQHADAEWARSSTFGERIAHGMLVVSFAVGLVPFEPERVVALRRVRDAVFRRPVRLGDTIHVEGRVAGTRAAGDEVGLVTLAIDVVRQDGLRACAAQVEVLWSAAAAARADDERHAAGAGSEAAGGNGHAAAAEDDGRLIGEMVWRAA
jgi:acyl dehydratase